MTAPVPTTPVARIEGRVAIVTGASGGIGRALAHAFADAGAAHVVLLDRDEAGLHEAAAAIGGTAMRVDVGDGAALRQAVARIEATIGPVGLFASNAGLFDADPANGHGASAPDDAWARGWAVNVMAHVFAARAVLPGMIARREGWLLQTASAAGLLSQIGSAVYSTTKHAAVGLATSLAIRHRSDGIGVSVLCPQAVATAMIANGPPPGAAGDGVLSPDAVAACAVAGMLAGRFMILPHEQVADYVRAKAADPDRWIAGMARLRARELAGC